MIGLAINTAFKAVTAPLITLITLTIAGAIVIIVPTELMILPMTISIGPKAVIKARTTSMIC